MKPLNSTLTMSQTIKTMNAASRSALFAKSKLEDLKVLRRSPDRLNNAKIVQGQLQLILSYHIWRLKPFWSSDLNNLMNNPSNSPVISAKKMFR